MVIGTDGNIENLFLISIEVAYENAVTAIGIFVPAFKRPGDACAGVADRFERQIQLRCKGGNTKGAREHKDSRKPEAEEGTEHKGGKSGPDPIFCNPRKFGSDPEFLGRWARR